MKTFTIEVVIESGNDEYWEGLVSEKKTGCDEITEIVRSLLDAEGWEATVTLTKYTDTGEN